MLRPDSRASAPPSELDGSTYDFMDDAMTDENANTEELDSVGSGSEFGDSIHGDIFDEDRDATDAKQEHDDVMKSSILQDTRSLSSTLTIRPNPILDQILNNGTTEDKLNSDISSMMREKHQNMQDDDAPETNDEQYPVKIESPQRGPFRILGVPIDIKMITLFIAGVWLAITYADYIPGINTSSVHSKEYEQFLRSNLPSLATATPSSSISSSIAPVNTDPVVDGSRFIDTLSFSSMTKSPFSMLSKGSSSDKKKEATQSQVSKSLSSAKDTVEDLSRNIKEQINKPINSRVKGNSVSAPKGRAYVCLNAGIIIPYISGPRPSPHLGCLGPYDELADKQQAFNMTYDLATRGSNITSTRPYRGSLAIFVTQDDKFVMFGHKQNATAPIEWVPFGIRLRGHASYEATVAVPAESKFQRTAIHFHGEAPNLFAVALRLTSALTTYVEPIQNSIQANSDKIDKLISSGAENIEKSVVRAQGSALVLANRLQTRVSTTLNKVIQRHAGIGDTLARVQGKGVQNLVLMGGKTRNAVAHAQKKVKSIAKQIKEKRLAKQHKARGSRKSRSSERKFSKPRWMEQIL